MKTCGVKITKKKDAKMFQMLCTAQLLDFTFLLSGGLQLTRIGHGNPYAERAVKRNCNSLSQNTLIESSIVSLWTASNLSPRKVKQVHLLFCSRLLSCIFQSFQKTKLTILIGLSVNTYCVGMWMSKLITSEREPNGVVWKFQYEIHRQWSAQLIFWKPKSQLSFQ